MKLFPLNYRAFVPTSLALSSVTRAFSSSYQDSAKWEGGVSMVQGASRGIGLEFVKQLLEMDGKGHVIATCRNPDGATGLLDLKNRFADRLNILQLDVTVESSIEASAMSIKERFGSLNLLINSTGILKIPNLLEPEKTLKKVEKSSLMVSYEVNAVGPILVIKHMWPLLKAGGGSGTQRDVAVVANLSARVGSIGDNYLGGWHAYRSSKAALNQLTRTVSMEFAQKKDPIVCILLHPGTVDTDLSRPYQRNVVEGKLFTKEFSVQKLLNIINNATSNDNGKFFCMGWPTNSLVTDPRPFSISFVFLIIGNSRDWVEAKTSYLHYMEVYYYLLQLVYHD